MEVGEGREQERKLCRGRGSFTASYIIDTFHEYSVGCAVGKPGINEDIVLVSGLN